MWIFIAGCGVGALGAAWFIIPAWHDDHAELTERIFVERQKAKKTDDKHAGIYGP